jgi:hypothetical protein
MSIQVGNLACTIYVAWAGSRDLTAVLTQASKQTARLPPSHPAPLFLSRPLFDAFISVL